MNLVIYGMWSPDLHPPDEGEGRPLDLTDFSVFVQVALNEIGDGGSEVYGLNVCSPSVLARTESGAFVSHTLVLERFSWEAIRARLDKLLMHTRSASTWDEVNARLSGLLFPSDV